MIPVLGAHSLVANRPEVLKMAPAVLAAAELMLECSLQAAAATLEIFRRDPPLKVDTRKASPGLRISASLPVEARDRVPGAQHHVKILAQLLARLQHPLRLPLRHPPHRLLARPDLPVVPVPLAAAVINKELLI